jgi:hypothetical protein
MLSLLYHLIFFPYYAVGLGFLMALVLMQNIVRRKHNRAQRLIALDYLSSLTTPQLRDLLGDAALPALLKAGDFERAEFLNDILAALWPYIDASLAADLPRMIAPILRQQKPPWMQDIALTRFSLGSRPPMLTGIKACSAMVAAGAGGGIGGGGGGGTGIDAGAGGGDTRDLPEEGTKVDRITLEMDFTWSSNMDVRLTVKPLPKQTAVAGTSLVRAKVGMGNVILNGECRISHGRCAALHAS